MSTIDIEAIHWPNIEHWLLNATKFTISAAAAALPAVDGAGSDKGNDGKYDNNNNQDDDDIVLMGDMSIDLSKKTRDDKRYYDLLKHCS